ncbi:hypothetical protein BLNAU_11584 [Blattamonas nauphoetae]|uniref:TOG domain-containing protein n=1 Tax=Blattamonas nauphoetae TaxID=2049346 RepID=A0ABQ9XPL6_9EUKA|nr:hypothetical protein BLNAU_11584 [Blattamonas nauphoetae]
MMSGEIDATPAPTILASVRARTQMTESERGGPETSPLLRRNLKSRRMIVKTPAHTDTEQSESLDDTSPFPSRPTPILYFPIDPNVSFVTVMLSQSPDAEIRNALKQTESKQWTDQNDGIVKLINIARQFPGDLRNHLHPLMISLCNLIANLRSSLSRNALAATAEIFLIFGRLLEAEVDLVLRCVMKKVLDSKDFITTGVDSVLGAIYHRSYPHPHAPELTTHSPTSFAKIVLKLLPFQSSKAVPVKLRCYRFIAYSLAQFPLFVDSPPPTPKFSKASSSPAFGRSPVLSTNLSTDLFAWRDFGSILTIIWKGVSDASGECREEARCGLCELLRRTQGVQDNVHQPGREPVSTWAKRYITKTEDAQQFVKISKEVLQNMSSYSTYYNSFSQHELESSEPAFPISFTPSSTRDSSRSDPKTPRSLRMRTRLQSGDTQNSTPTPTTPVISREKPQKRDDMNSLSRPLSIENEMMMQTPIMRRQSTGEQEYPIITQHPYSTPTSPINTPQKPISRLTYSRRSKKSVSSSGDGRGGLDPVRRSSISVVEVSRSLAQSVDNMMIDLRSFEMLQQLEGLGTLENLLNTIPIPTICYAAYLLANPTETSTLSRPHAHASSDTIQVPRNIALGCGSLLDALIPLLEDESIDIQARAISVLGSTFPVLRSAMEDSLPIILKHLANARNGKSITVRNAANETIKHMVTTENWVNKDSLDAALKAAGISDLDEEEDF